MLSAVAADAGPLLLISVFQESEVEAALAGGADIVDLKNPAEGSLGAPTPSELQAVRRRVPSVLSVALGDAPHLPGTFALAAAAAAAVGADYLKVGLLGSARPEQARDFLSAIQRAVVDVNPRARVIGVAYADASRVGGLPPDALPRAAAEARIHGVMLDTAVKDGTSTFAALGEEGVRAFLLSARSFGLQTALAGALGPLEVARAGALGAQIVGVRGSACEGGREGRLSAERVRALRASLKESASLSYARP